MVGTLPPSVQVTPDSGFLIEPIDPNKIVKDIADAMTQVYNNPRLIFEKGQNAKKRVEENLTWEAKSDAISKVYFAAVNESRTR